MGELRCGGGGGGGSIALLAAGAAATIHHLYHPLPPAPPLSSLPSSLPPSRWQSRELSDALLPQWVWRSPPTINVLIMVIIIIKVCE